MNSRYLLKERRVDNPVDDSDAVACRLRQGHREALSELFSQQWDQLWRIVNFRMDRRLLGRVDPDDVLQEAYLAAAGRLKHYGPDSSFSPFVWLRMILMQTLTDVHRHHLGTQMRDAGREVGGPGWGYPQSTSASL